MSRDMLQKLSPRDMVRSGLCIGCGACVHPGDLAMAATPWGELKPGGSRQHYAARTASFAALCPFSPAAINEDELSAACFPDLPLVSPLLGRLRAAYVGYVAEESFRSQGSSGGMASWVLRELLRSGRIDGVAHVVPCDLEEQGGRLFHYRISRTEEEIRGGAKSRYYPVELSGVLESIRAVPGKYAVVGVPCFIKALRLLARQDPVIRDRVAYTVGLFCGHMKSQRLAESFAWQMDCKISQVQGIDYRRKDPSRPARVYTAELTLKTGEVRRKDWSNLPDGDWGAGFFQNSACNYCDDVVAETADISLGDAWVEPYSSDGMGTNVVLIRSAELHGMILKAIADQRLKLDPVDEEFVERTQAAGLRQRHEGLSYRLTWRKRGIVPRKRVSPLAKNLPMQRKLLYRMRAFISAWSHRLFWCARCVSCPSIYLTWARVASSIYEGCAYQRGRWGKFFSWLSRRQLP